MPVVMGTAGHIDHGKTTLIKALTGIDCDRLIEEKRRGITIELGFAELQLPDPNVDGKTYSISVIDVPGHEKFVHTMVAGASGIDFVLLIIAADEGVMPQTREHLEICSLLGISNGAVALTKIDLVDAEMLSLAIEDVQIFLQGTILKDAPIIPVSAHNGQGLQDLREILANLTQKCTSIRSQDLFRLPIDRVFTMRGHGTVVTGTMIAGNITLGETICVYPEQKQSKLRSLQSHGQSVETALAGRRTAVNLPDLAVNEIHKGDVLGRPESLFPSLRWITWISCLSSSPRPIRNRTEIHLHHGSRELQARLYFVDRDKLLPSESCLCEVRLPEPYTAVFGDHIVLRSFSPLRTVAGGVILTSLGLMYRLRGSKNTEQATQLQKLVPFIKNPLAISSTEKEKLVYTQLLYTENAPNGLPANKLQTLTNLDSNDLDKVCASLCNQHKIFCFDKIQHIYITDIFYNQYACSCLEHIKQYHEQYKERQGIKRSELISSWGKEIPLKLAYFILEQLGKIAITAEGEFIRLNTHNPKFSGSNIQISEALLKAHQEAGITPPTLHVLLESLNISSKEALPVLSALRSAGKLERVSDAIWYAIEPLQEIKTAITTWFTTHETIDLAGLKEITGLSRKYLVALLEYFDAQKITMRVGDVRILRKN